MGESYGRFKIGNDEAIFPFISSSNIACGFHGGDPLHIEHTVNLAITNRVRIGAHPGYPDLAGFGRRYMQIQSNELRAIVKYQVAALKGIAESMGGTLAYVKPHGALYNRVADDMDAAQAVIQAIKEIDPKLYLMGLAGSPIQQLAKEKGIPFIAEAFADRKYEKNGRLRSRSLPNAVITDPFEAAEQVINILLHKKIKSHDGHALPLEAQSFCIHGDNPKALDILKAIHEALKENDIEWQKNI